VFAEGFRLIAGGVVSGIVVAMVLSRVLASLLFEVEPADPGDARRRGAPVCGRGAAGVLGAHPSRGAGESVGSASV
jgi:putative ABC transport system permease protein